MATILHCIAGYFFLLLTVRVLTRRPGAQMTLFEFVIVFLIGGVIILATVGHDRSVTNCTLAVITVGLLHRAVSGAKTKWPKLAALVDGKPLVLYRNGMWQEEAMQGMRLAPEDVLASARTKGIARLEEIQFAVLERNGGISVIKREDEE
jgi:uncharacterized membrane protein YcaP (DUF421 family)